ncbi:MAG: alpha/beta hydrolase [Gordonia sp. (in: high G+C Gram-positive bacteria)]|uniref:alpha/beta hydrolase n=1 Tax=Gordonia sp. (in: high G+C Gram-positive bacteria) TaxID=84139 RepID=UPI0039E388AE
MAKQDILLIHGTWGSSGSWDHVVPELTKRGYNVHAPTLPGHGKASEVNLEEKAAEVVKCGLNDYVDFLQKLVADMKTTPIIVGHSLGGLIAQLLAAKVPSTALILLAPAPAAGVFAQYPSTTILWSPYLFTWLRSKPMWPVKKAKWDKYIANELPADLSEEFYAELCAESGKVYRQMALWQTDRSRQAKVDFDAITSPVLVVSGEKDLCCLPAMNKATAKRYKGRADYAEVEGSDHIVTAGPALPKTMAILDDWIAKQGLGPDAAKA